MAPTRATGAGRTDNVAPDNQAERTDAAAPEAARPEAPAHGGRFTRIFGRFTPPDKIPATSGIGPTATPRHDFCPAAAGRMRTGMGPCVRADLEIRRKVTILQPNRRRPDAFPMTETEYEPKKRIAYRKIFYSLNQRRKRV